MSSGKEKNAQSTVPTVRAKPSNDGGGSGNQSKMCMSGKCRYIGISVVIAIAPFDIIPKEILKPIRQNGCAC
jgi:hypothetical protein